MRARLLGSVLAAVFSAALAFGAVGGSVAVAVSAVVPGDSGWNPAPPPVKILGDSGWNAVKTGAEADA